MSATRYRSLLWLGLGCTLGASASAHEISATPAVPTFESLDRNSDNRLSRTEAGYNRLLSEIFAGSDLDGDGFVSRDEYHRATRSGAGDATLRRI